MLGINSQMFLANIDGVVIVNFELISHIVLLFSLLTSNK